MLPVAVCLSSAAAATSVMSACASTTRRKNMNDKEKDFTDKEIEENVQNGKDIDNAELEQFQMNEGELVPVDVDMLGMTEAGEIIGGSSEEMRTTAVAVKLTPELTDYFALKEDDPRRTLKYVVPSTTSILDVVEPAVKDLVGKGSGKWYARTFYLDKERVKRLIPVERYSDTIRSIERSTHAAILKVDVRKRAGHHYKEIELGICSDSVDSGSAPCESEQKAQKPRTKK